MIRRKHSSQGLPFHFGVYKVFAIIQYYFHFGTADHRGSPFNVLINMQSFTAGLGTAVAVHLYSPHYYTVFHHATADCGRSPINVFIITQHFTAAMRTAAAVSLMSSLLYSLLPWDCGPWWQSSLFFSLFHYRTMGCFPQVTFHCGWVFCNGTITSAQTF